MRHGARRITRPLVRPLVRYAAGLSFDASDLSNGTLSLDFVGVEYGQTLGADFLTDTYIVWAEDPTWPYGVVGVFQVKGYQ